MLSYMYSINKDDSALLLISNAKEERDVKLNEHAGASRAPSDEVCMANEVGCARARVLVARGCGKRIG